MTSQSFEISPVWLEIHIIKKGIFLNIKVQRTPIFSIKFRGFCWLFMHAFITHQLRY